MPLGKAARTGGRLAKSVILSSVMSAIWRLRAAVLTLVGVLGVHQGRYELRNATFGVAGTWQATVTARVSKFHEYTAKTEFKIRP